jgi:ABC-type transport system involved in multi-copper enzyme maturation permease subunit
MPVAPVVYTLTLPISRTRLIWTRLAAGLGVACILATLLTAGGVVWFTTQGQTVPIAAVLQSLVLGVVVLATMLAIMSAVVTALPGAWGFLGILGILALAIPNSYVVSAPARGDVPWLAVGGYVIALVAAMRFTLSYVRTREY